jgi:hypothetical protein
MMPRDQNRGMKSAWFNAFSHQYRIEGGRHTDSIILH